MDKRAVNKKLLKLARVKRERVKVDGFLKKNGKASLMIGLILESLNFAASKCPGSMSSLVF